MTRRAVTLIEVLVALTLGAILLITVQGLAVGAFVHHQTLAERIDTGRSERWLADVLRYDLSNLAAPPACEIRDGEFIFQGLTALSSERLAARERVEITYSLRDGELLRLESDPGDDSAGNTAKLAADVRQFQVLIHDGQDWHARWPLETPRVARAIRVSLESDTDPVELTVPLSAIAWRRHDE